jgi:regulatory protein
MGAANRPRGTAKDRALRLLGVRARGREELRRRLAQAGFEADEVETALGDLERVGLIDDERFAREVAAYEMGRRGMGRRAALASLRRRGLAPDLAERVVEELAPDDEDERAAELAQSRLARMDGLADDVAHRRLVGFLQRRGYEARVAHGAARKALADRAGAVA